MDFRFSERASTVTEIHEHPRHSMQVKSHQAEGFVFLVSNLVAENPWGCILVHAPDLESLKWPQSYSPIKFVSHTSQRGWVWKRKWISSDVKQRIPVGLLELGDTILLRLSSLTQSGLPNVGKDHLQASILA